MDIPAKLAEAQITRIMRAGQALRDEEKKLVALKRQYIGRSAKADAKTGEGATALELAGKYGHRGLISALGAGAKRAGL